MNVEQAAEGDLTPSKMARIAWRKAQQAFKRRDYIAASKEVRHLLDVHGAHAVPVPAEEIYTFYGVILLRLRRTDEGVEQLLAAVSANPNMARARYKLGLGYSRQGRQDDALDQFLRALNLDRSNAEYLCRLGLQYRRLGRIGEAQVAYEAAQSIEPDRKDAIQALHKLSNSIDGGASSS